MADRARHWNTAGPTERAKALEREGVIRPLASKPSLSYETVDEAAQQLGLGRSLMYRLIARYRERPRTSSLLPQRRGRPKGQRHLDDELEALITKTIDGQFLTEERPRLADLMRALELACHQRRLKPPSYRTVKRRVDAIDRRRIVTRRFGPRAAEQAFGRVGVSPLNALQPLDMFQVDHTPVDVIVVDSRDRRPIGRPALTLVVDVASRVVAGFAVALEPPSTVSVALALTHAALPKETWSADRDLDLDWPVSGVPVCLHVDNAKEFESQALERGTEEHGIHLIHRPVGRPSFGGHIERLIGTMMGAVHLLPGTTFSNVAAKGDYPAEDRAALTLGELERWLALEIAAYHRRVHRVLGRPPLDVWREGLQRRTTPPRHPADPEQFFVDFLPAVRRKVRRDGIRLFGIHYWDNVLSPLAGRSGRAREVRYDPRDLSRVFLVNDEGPAWPIPYADLGWPPVSLWEQRDASARLRAAGRHAVDTDTLMQTVVEQRRIVDEAQRLTARARRRRAQRPRSKPAAPTSAPLSTDAPLSPGAVHLEDWND